MGVFVREYKSIFQKQKLIKSLAEQEFFNAKMDPLHITVK